MVTIDGNTVTLDDADGYPVELCNTSGGWIVVSTANPNVYDYEAFTNLCVEAAHALDNFDGAPQQAFGGLY